MKLFALALFLFDLLKKTKIVRKIKKYIKIVHSKIKEYMLYYFCKKKEANEVVYE